jgi:hypothetical protein
MGRLAKTSESRIFTGGCGNDRYFGEEKRREENRREDGRDIPVG